MSLRYNPNDANHLRDAQHAQNLFRANNFQLAPKNKFLYHVVFVLKDEEVRTLAPTTREQIKEIGVLAKNIDLPGFKVSVDTKQQYNRKKNYQTRIDYEECRCVFHDDNTGLTTTMLREYYNYFYRDGVRNNTNNYGTRNKYGEHRHRYGLDNGSRDTFFDFIKIYQLARKQWFSFTLINPILTAWNHDTLDYSDAGGMMENTINIAYEAVLYDQGEILTELDGNSNTATIRSEQGEPTHFGSGETFYDLVHSPLISNGAEQPFGKQTQSSVTREDLRSRTEDTLRAQINDFSPASANLLQLATERGPLPPVKNNTQTNDVFASSPSFNQLFTTDPLAPEEIASELDADPALQDTLVQQSVLTGQVEGFDSTNSTEFESLSTEEQTTIKTTVVTRATSSDRSKPENIKTAVLATNVITKKKQAQTTTREVSLEDLYPPPTPSQRAEQIDASIRSKQTLLRNFERIRDRSQPGGDLEGARTAEQLQTNNERIERLTNAISELETERSQLDL